MAMGSALDSTLADAFLVYLKKKKKNDQNVVHSNINHFTIKGTLMIYFLYNLPEHLKRFQSDLNSRYVNLSFTVTIENKKD